MVKLGVGIGSRRTARRVAVVDAYRFPSGVRQRVRLKHPGFGAEQSALVESALRQWFRILARHPSAQLSMPSMSVDDMWHEFLLHTRDYAAFCDAAFGRFLHHQPESAMTREQVIANRSDLLLATLRLARADENCGRQALPLLFRVDQEVGHSDCRRYLADCGGRSQCYDSEKPGLVCLWHLSRAKRSPLRSGPRFTDPNRAGGGSSPHGADCAGGCGGGGCGGG